VSAPRRRSAVALRSSPGSPAGPGRPRRWDIVYAKSALKDAHKLAASGLRTRAEELLAVIGEDPFCNPPPYEKPVGDLAGAYSRRINIQHRIVYEVFAEQRVVRILRMWTHYE
jgi:Txe/YoeB family toxin of toxin-antitoxin system